MDAQVIGLSGGGGGWSREDEGKWIDDATLLLTRAAYYDDFETTEDGFDQIMVNTSCINLTIDYNGHLPNQTTDGVHTRAVQK
ncbi:MAG: hypothetical protein JKY52_15075 [Flavobacteriales bacterium]|nr:hypothetical protein [Flavobacteriales bacterium]